MIVDTREKEEVYATLRKLKFTYTLQKLDSGDYQSDRCLFERKTFFDLTQSLMTQRLLKQLERMYTYCSDHKLLGFLCISGSIDDVHEMSKRHGFTVNDEALYGIMASALVRYGMNVIWNCKDTEELLRVIWKIAEKVDEGKLDSPHRSTLREIHPDKRIALVCQVLRVSPKIAREMLTRFGNLRGILLASDQQLLMISGIGKTTLERIKSLVW